MIVVRGWLNLQFGRRRRWARLSLLWMHVAFAVFAGWSLYAVTQAVVFYPYYMMELLIYVICGCGLLIYLLARKDVARLVPPRPPGHRELIVETMHWLRLGGIEAESMT